MPSKRSFFAADEMEGRIYVAGGHDNSKNRNMGPCGLLATNERIKKLLKLYIYSFLALIKTCFIIVFIYLVHD